MDRKYVHKIDDRTSVPNEHTFQHNVILAGLGDLAKVLWVWKDIDWAFTLSKVQCVFLDDCLEDVLMDQSVGLQVRVTRKLSKTELVRRQSWLWRAVWWLRDHQNRKGVPEGTTFPLTKVMSMCS